MAVSMIDNQSEDVLPRSPRDITANGSKREGERSRAMGDGMGCRMFPGVWMNDTGDDT